MPALTSPAAPPVWLDWLRPGDFPAYADLYADPQVALPTGLEVLHGGAARDWFDTARELPVQQGRIFALRPRGQSQLCGVLRLTDWDHGAQHITLGYALARRYWGRGWMRACLDEVLPWLLDGGLGERVHRVQAWVLPHNYRSARLLRGAGFQLEGTLRDLFMQDGARHDVQCYGLLTSDLARAAESAGAPARALAAALPA